MITSHGNFCTGLLSSYEMIVGQADRIIAVELDDNGLGEFSQKLHQTLDLLTGESQVLIFTDLKGGTPYNESYHYYLQHPEKIRIISGMNLPMLIETGISLTTINDIDRLVEIAVDAGKSSVEKAQVQSGEIDLEF